MPRAPKKAAVAAPSVIVNTRFQPTENAALEKAAKDDARPKSSLIHKIVADWLKERGYLK